MMKITELRRKRQMEYNKAYGITPQSVKRTLSEDNAVESVIGKIDHDIVAEDGVEYDIAVAIANIEREMIAAAEALEFERAAALRDELKELKMAHMRS